MLVLREVALLGVHMSLDLRLQPLFASSSTEEVLQEAELLLVDAEVGITFWGNRVLKVRECEGSGPPHEEFILHL